MNLGAGYLRQGRPELAIERLQRALEQNPRLADAHSTIAVAYDQLGSAADAEEHYKRATQLEPDQFAGREQLRRVPVPAEPLARRGALFQASRRTTRATRTPEVALANAGLCALGSGDRREGRRELPRRAHQESDVRGRAVEHARDVLPGQELPAGTRVPAALHGREARRRRPCCGCASTSSGSSRIATRPNRCASQLREGFPGSPGGRGTTGAAAEQWPIVSSALRRRRARRRSRRASGRY